MKYLYIVILFVLLGLFGYLKLLTHDLNSKTKKVGELSVALETSSTETNLTSISSLAIGELKQIKKEEQNEKKPPSTIGSHSYTF